MARNKNLNRAGKAKNDEFYTRLHDIERECRFYWDHFRGKTILCNCDDPYESNFFRYFALKFKDLGLKKLIATSYVDSPIAGEQLSLADIGKDPKKAYKAVITDVHGDPVRGGFNLDDIKNLFITGENELTELEGNGDFRSPECLELLDEADIVVTNPPFSLFREYVKTLVEHDKKFLIWGNNNAITYKEIFPLLKDNKIWLGNTTNQTLTFQLPDYYEKWDEKLTEKINDGHKYGKVPAISTFTNLDIQKRHEEMILFRKYDPELYPKYDNYDAIEVSKVKYIPCDYSGVMGVPLTFFNVYNPDQFEILGSQRWAKSDELLDLHISNNREIARNDKKTLINGHETYDRIFIKNRHPSI